MADQGYIDYTTPDGRQLRLPPAVAASLQGLTPVQSDPGPAIPDGLAPPAGAGPQELLPPPVGPSTGPLPDLPAQQDHQQPAALGGAGLPPPPPGAQSFYGGQVDPAEVRAGVAGMLPQPSAAPAPAPGGPPPPADAARPGQPPAPAAAAAPVTTAGLRRLTEADLLNRRAGALEQGRSAEATSILDAGELARKEADEMDAHIARQDALDRKTAADAERRVAEINAKSAAIDSHITAYGTRKVSPAIQHKTIAGIGLALGILGQALGGEKGENPAMKALLAGIETSVNRQIAERDHEGKVIGLEKGQLDALRSQLTDQSALHAGLSAAEAMRTKNTIDALAKRAGTTEARAKLEKLSADFSMRATDLLATTHDRQIAADDRARAAAAAEQARRAAAAERAADRKQAAYQFEARLGLDRETLQLKREAEANDLAKATAGANAKAIAAGADKARELGIRDPATAELLLDQQGQKMMADADALERQANKLRASPTGAAQADVVAAKAAAIRGEARSTHFVPARDAKSAGDLSTALSARQTTIGLIDEIKRDAKSAGTKVLSEDEVQARLGARIGILTFQLKEAYKAGALDEGTDRAFNKITGGDPSKLTTAGVLAGLGIGTDKAEITATRLDAIASALEASSQNDLRAAGIKGFKFKRDEERPYEAAATALARGKTPLEQSNNLEPTAGLAGAEVLAKNLFNPLGGGQTLTERKRSAIEERSSSLYPGLDPDQEKSMTDLLATAKQDTEDGDRVRAFLVSQVTENATSRPEYSSAVANVLKANAPELYKTAVAGLPDDQRAARQRSAGQALQTTDLRQLESLATGGDRTAAAELFRRSTASGPSSAAGQAWARVLPTLDKGQ